MRSLAVGVEIVKIATRFGTVRHNLAGGWKICGERLIVDFERAIVADGLGDLVVKIGRGVGLCGLKCVFSCNGTAQLSETGHPLKSANIPVSNVDKIISSATIPISQT